MNDDCTDQIFLNKSGRQILQTFLNSEKGMRGIEGKITGEE